ncbi:MAG: DEAD/DEAH box helicase, partial [Desulfosalsimonadaceae bacterium]
MTLNHRNFTTTDFQGLRIAPALTRALEEAGYETPTPIQAKTIPPLMAGRDLIGQAQTGTGKTAAFALPILSRIDLESAAPQALVLTPTRELAIQVSESFHSYAAHLQNFRVLPIYGGQDYSGQLRRLKQGVQVVVGTPGRVMDHMRRKSLKMDSIKSLVLDEADEMLRMGFLEDVEWILGQTPPKRQIALFSATVPQAIRNIAQKYMQQPEQITIKARTMTVATTRQRYWIVGDNHKLDALTRILEAEPFDGVIIFVRTKTATAELAKKLEARGYLSAALNGDISQSMREKTLALLKEGKLDILAATDVAARGLDVDRISHVINYDVPYDPEAYVHRIGRTGRAGRSGEAILFITPRERRMLRAIEGVTRQ